jgi:hypothetical protein
VSALTQEEVLSARGLLDEIIAEVCGACELNCCLQGTMVGGDDARRIARAARLSPDFREQLVGGLAERGAELRRDLEGIERAARLLEMRPGADDSPALGRLRAALDDWRGFCGFLEREFRAEPAEIRRCLVFSGIRATALRALRAFPGGEQVLPTLAGSGTSFRAGRRGVKADRCLFHLRGCLVPRAKPHKCADFYCGADPGLVHEVVDRMTFDRFVLAHFELRTAEDILRDVSAELSLGVEYLEPKVVVGGDVRLWDALRTLLSESFPQVTRRSLGGGHFDVALDVPDWGKLARGEALVVEAGSADALAVYELAVSLVRARGRSLRPPAMVLVSEWRRRAGADHDLWRTRAMSQPVSALNLWGVLSAAGQAST